MSLTDAKAKLRKRVLTAAMDWHKWLTIGGVGADYRRYRQAFERLQRACNALKRSA